MASTNKLNPIPHPPKKPVVGNMLSLDPNAPVQHLTRLIKELGPIFWLDMMGAPLVIVGLFGGGAPWALPLIPIKAVTIQGSYVGNLRETRELLDLVRTKKIPPIPVTPMPLAKANDALLDLQKGRLVGRAVLTP